MHEYVQKSKDGQEAANSADGGQAVRPALVVQKIPASAPLSWLKRGVQDVHACHYISLLYGVCFVLMGLGIDRAHSGNPALALGLSAGFLFAGSFLAMGLYELSRQRQSGEPVDLLLSLFSWCRNPAAVGHFALYLSVIMMIWLRLSSTLLHAVGQPFGPALAIAVLAWALIALMVFMGSAVAIPMILDRPVGAVEAVRTSVRCCRVNSGALALWAVIIAVSVGISLRLQYWPLLVVGPVLGHATWHAYQTCLRENDVPSGAGAIPGKGA
ncbi:MAG: DUF2189 domain-containing protein [Granulosicoccus sp.]|nr:DUF2189 domain-containing protein [Granulosicoccus sp.]